MKSVWTYFDNDKHGIFVPRCGYCGRFNVQLMIHWFFRGPYCRDCIQENLYGGYRNEEEINHSNKKSQEHKKMKLFVYSVFDQASGVFDRPFIARAEAEAIRSFTDICKDESHPIGKHPEHYTLVNLGVFDDNKGTITHEKVETVITGLEATAGAKADAISNDS